MNGASRAGAGTSGRWREDDASTLHVGAPNVPSPERFLDLVGQALDANRLTNDGPLLRRLECSLAEYLEVSHCVLVANGTVALEIAARCMDLRGEVILPSLTFVASAGALQWLGLTPVFCDVDPATYCVDPADIEQRITPRTSAIMGVHLFGRPCDVACLGGHRPRPLAAALLRCCTRVRLLAGRYHDRRVRILRSVQLPRHEVLHHDRGRRPATNDDDLAHRARLGRNFGFEDGAVRGLGINGKMSEVCAAMGIANLERLPDVVACNRRNFEAYREGFADVPGIRMAIYDEAERQNYQYVLAEVLPEFGLSRDALMAWLQGHQVLARDYFAPGCHRVEPFASALTHDPGLPHTEELSDRLITFPTGIHVGDSDVRRVVALVRQAGGGPGGGGGPAGDGGPPAGRARGVRTALTAPAMFLHLLAPDRKFFPVLRRLFETAAPGRHVWVVAGAFDQGFELPDGVQHVTSRGEMQEVIAGVAPLEGVVLNGLRFAVAGDLLHALPPSTAVAWYVWGFEAYLQWSGLQKGLLLPQTAEVMRGLQPPTHGVRTARQALRRWVRGDRRAGRRLVGRLDFCVSPFIEEYQLYRRAGLPEETRYHAGLVGTLEDYVDNSAPIESLEEPATSGIQVGNSAWPSNNHVDALSLIAASPGTGTVVVPLGYGEPRYAARRWPRAGRSSSATGSIP